MEDGKIYKAPEQKLLRYKKPDGSIPVNGASLLFAKYSFWNFENRIDIRKYFVTKFETGKNPTINAKLMPGKKGICLTFPEAVELVKALRAMLRVAKYCTDDAMQPDEEMIQVAMGITYLGFSEAVVGSRKRHASDSGSTVQLGDKKDDESPEAKTYFVQAECSQAFE